MRFKVVVWHGEHRTLFYVVDTAAHQDDQPAVVVTYHSRREADEAARCFNGAGAVITAEGVY